MFTTKDLNSIVTGTPDERIHKTMQYITNKEGGIDPGKLAALLAAILNVTKSGIRDWLAVEEAQVS